MSFDREICIDATLNDLRTDHFKTFYLPKAVDEETLKKNHRSMEQQLSSLRFFDLKFNVPTNAGVIIFGIKPTHHIAGSYSQFVKFPLAETTPHIEYEK
ncbi:MAG: hypothetical protein H7296_02035 [Bacteroidia bacterium]|nr:hypothetical protein [Bacteroidia bacterium]